MSDPLSTDPISSSGPPGDAEREARIEELLLSGLDHYFGGQYERAINVWTRVVFLERHHDRARAYIERARSALAERQREAEELLHTGMAAYNAGEIERARDFLTRAVEQGSDTAHVFLDRLNRVGSAVVGGDVRPQVASSPRTTAAGRASSARRRKEWIAAGIAAIAVAATMLVSGLPIGTWLSELQMSAPPAALDAAPAEPLPVVRASETALARAKALRAGGHLWDALRAIDRIDLADPLRGEADRLRAEIQRDLLAASGLGTADARDAEPRP
jgi:hypothetical protein